MQQGMGALRTETVGTGDWDSEQLSSLIPHSQPLWSVCILPTGAGWGGGGCCLGPGRRIQSGQGSGMPLAYPFYKHLRCPHNCPSAPSAGDLIPQTKPSPAHEMTVV